MPGKNNPPVSVAYELLDAEGFEEWTKDNVMTEKNAEVMLNRFFKKRDDMTAEDFQAGIDPLIDEKDGD